MAPLNETLLDELLGQLESVRAWSPRVLSKFETFIRTADDYALFRVNPVGYANERSMNVAEAIDLFLHAVKVGLFTLEWHLICASCGHVVNSLRNMSDLHAHFRCNLCAYEATATLDDTIQVTFTLAPRIRAIAYHQPATLSAEDFCFKYNLCKELTPPPGFNSYVDFMRAATQLIVYVEPGEQHQVAFAVVPGLVSCIDLLHNTSVNLEVRPTPAAEQQAVSVQWAAGKLHATNRDLHPVRVDFGHSAFEFDQFGELATGQLTLTFENHMTERGLLWVPHFRGEPIPPGSLPFQPFLSGKQLITTQTFRELFRTETIATDEGLGVRDITILFTDLKGSTALYDTIGDLKAYFLVRQHFDTLSNIIHRYAGATIKTIGDAVMATFMTPLDAVQAALQMLRDLAAFNRDLPDKLILKIGIHSGHSIAVSLNDRLDYFGQTVNIAARVQGLADAGEIYLSAAVYAFPGVSEAVAHCTVTPAQVTVKGVSETIQVYKILPA